MVIVSQLQSQALFFYLLIDISSVQLPLVLTSNLSWSGPVRAAAACCLVKVYDRLPNAPSSTWCMGKRKPRGGLGGLAQFALDAFKQDTNGAGPCIGNAQSSEGQEPKEPSTKRRKMDSENGAAKERNALWVQKYEATGLVVHYADASQVPEHLQKCACLCVSSRNEHK